MLLLLAALTVRVTVAPIVFHTPAVVADYTQETQRHVARDAIEARLLSPDDSSRPWRRGRDQDRGILIEVAGVRLRADGETAFISQITGTKGQTLTVKHYEVTTTVHVPTGQTRTIVGAETELALAARRVADQITAWLGR